MALRLDDPNVKLPAAVIAAGARSDELSAKYANGDPPQEENSNGDDSAPKTEPERAPKTEPQAKETLKAPPRPQATQESNDQKQPNWEQRYNAMKGRYDSDTRRMGGQIEDMQRLLASMQASPQPQQPPAPAAPDARFVTPKEIDEYGADWFDVVGRRAKEIATEQNKELRFELDALKRQISGVAQVTAMSEKEKLLAALEQDIPNWRELNQSKEFLAWLALPDAYSGATRQTLLTNAFSSNQTNRVIAFFRGFLADEATTRPAEPNQPPSAANKQPPRVDLKALAAPGRARQAAANAPPEKQTITRAEIAEFYSSVQKGEWAGRDADKLAVEKQIFDAQRDGRIR